MEGKRVRYNNFFVLLTIFFFINASFSYHSLLNYATYSASGAYYPYSLRVLIYNNGTIRSSLGYILNMSNGLFSSFNVEDFGFKIYHNGKLYIYTFPRQSNEELQKIIGKVNETLLTINSIMMKKDSSHWVYGICDFSSSIQKIINFARDISEEAAEVLSLSNCSYVAAAFYGTQMVLEFGCCDNLLRFKLGEDLYFLNVSMLYIS